MATCSGVCSSITLERFSKMTQSFSAMEICRGITIPPNAMQRSSSRESISTTPYPVHSVPQSIPKTRIYPSLLQTTRQSTLGALTETVRQYWHLSFIQRAADDNLLHSVLRMTRRKCIQRHLVPATENMH